MATPASSSAALLDDRAVNQRYAHFGSKDGLVEAYLRRRDRRWLDWLHRRIDTVGDGRERVLAVFDALGEWFAEPGFSGCVFINVAGELASNPMARTVAREHKLALRALLHRVAAGAGGPDPGTLAERLMLLVEGAIVTAYVEGDESAAAPRGSGVSPCAAGLRPPWRSRCSTPRVVRTGTIGVPAG